MPLKSLKGTTPGLATGRFRFFFQLRKALACLAAFCSPVCLFVCLLVRLSMRSMAVGQTGSLSACLGHLLFQIHSRSLRHADLIDTAVHEFLSIAIWVPWEGPPDHVHYITSAFW